MIQTITFVPEMPADATGVFAHYQLARVSKPGWREVDIRLVCHRHQDEWAEALCDWHSRMMAGISDISPRVWLLQGSRIHVWQEPIRPLLFALGVAAYLRETGERDLHLVGCPAEVARYVPQLLGDQVRVIRRGGAPAIARPWWRVAGRWAAEAWSLSRRAGRTRPMSTQKTDLLVFSMALSGAAITQRGDHYFGRAFDSLGLSTGWLYELEDSNRLAELESALEGSGRRFSFAHDWLSRADLPRAVSSAIALQRALRAAQPRLPPLQWRGMSCLDFARDYYRMLILGVPALRELLVLAAARRALAATRPGAVCYPYEEKGMERALLQAVDAECPGARTIGFAHNAYNSGLLYVNESKTAAGRPPRPDLLAAGGLGLAEWFARLCGRHDAIETVGSPRWIASAGERRTRTAGAPLEVLFLTGFGYELYVLADWIQRHPEAFEGCVLTIRPNPHAWPEEQAAAFARIRAVSFVRITGDATLAGQLEASDVVLFCSTSAASEAIWSGRLAVYAEFSDLWVANPFDGKSATEVVPRCGTPAELKARLASLAALSQDEYDRAVEAQRLAAAQVYAPFDGPAFARVVKACSTEATV